MIEARFENGASITMANVDMNGAAQLARDSVASCVPENMREGIVPVTVTRRVAHCALCGRRPNPEKALIAELGIGADAVVCYVCADAVIKAACSKPAAPPKPEPFKPMDSPATHDRRKCPKCGSVGTYAKDKAGGTVVCNRDHAYKATPETKVRECPICKARLEGERVGGFCEECLP